MNEGWICPRCGRVNAPFIPYCECKQQISNSCESNSCESNSCECIHYWIPDYISTNYTQYICVKCGKKLIKTSV